MIYHFLCESSVVWQLTISSCGCLQSGIPSNAGPFPGTTNKVHPYLMPLLIIAIENMPICGMQELL